MSVHLLQGVNKQKFAKCQNSEVVVARKWKVQRVSMDTLQQY
jgi:hypothetical protein